MAQYMSPKFKAIADLKKYQVAVLKTQALLTSIKNRRVYFDFETINPAIRAFDNTFAFQQILTQCSFIKMVDGEESEIKDLICDPLHLKNTFFIEVVDSLYEVEDCSYIVYNKTFEIGRLQEIKRILSKEYAVKIDKICDNIIDLDEIFNPNKEIILDPRLKGYHSIKKVLKLCDAEIMQQTQSVLYSQLQVKNGKQALDLTMLRSFKIIDEIEWLKWSINLKKYCQNDVRAMIAVEKLATQMLNDNLNSKN